jgi:Ca2+-binding EF-hand superfamily protein
MDAPVYGCTCRLDNLNESLRKCQDKLTASEIEKEELSKVMTLWSERCGKKVGIDPGAKLEELIAKVDVNGDGKLSLAEFVPLFEDLTITCGLWALTA